MSSGWKFFNNKKSMGAALHLGGPGEKMRLVFLLVPFFLLLCHESHGAGFIGPGSMEPVHQAIDVLNAPDDAPCMLEGQLVAKVRGRKNRYIFKDASGEVVVEIKRKLFGDRIVSPENIIRIEGEVDVDDKYPNEIKADSLTVLK